MDQHSRNKAALEPLRAAMVDWTEAGVRRAFDEILAPDAIAHFCHPLGDVAGNDIYDCIHTQLHTAWPDVERRDYIVMGGPDDDGNTWVGCGGFYCGTFLKPFLDIPPTGHLAHMRFHEFYRFEGGKVVEIQALWDIPEVMMQAGAWPMSPSLGREWHIPGPATHDGIVVTPHDAKQSDRAHRHVVDMLIALTRHPDEPEEAMELSRFWHPRMNWYGPSGIGTGRGIAGFRNWHQIPFLAAMPDRGQFPEETKPHFFADGAYVAVTGWPDMAQTLDESGWLGIAPTKTKITMRSLDFWRLEGGKIRENWVLVDLLHVYDQIGVDVLGRMREFNKARNMGPIDLPIGAMG